MARYLAQLDTADLQEPSEELAAKTVHLKEKLVKLESEMQRLAASGRTRRMSRRRMPMHGSIARDRARKPSFASSAMA